MLELVKPTAVVFLGGCTESEIECLRAMGRMLKRDLIVMTSSIVNGKMILRQFKKVLYKPLGEMLSAGVVEFCKRK